MKTYEQFINESNFQSIKSIGYFKSLLNKKELKNWSPDKQQFYRIFKSRFNKKDDQIFIFDPTTIYRKSRTGNNFMNSIISLWDNYPSRFNSSSFTNDIENAKKNYGLYTYGDVNDYEFLYYLIPFNGANIAISPVDDINLKPQFYNKKYNLSLNDMYLIISDIYLYAKKDFLIVDNVNVLINNLNIIDEWVRKKTNLELFDNLKNRTQYKYIKFEELFDDIRKTDLLSFLLKMTNPNDNGFSHITFDWKNDNNILFNEPRELWTDSKYILMNLKTLDKIKNNEI